MSIKEKDQYAGKYLVMTEGCIHESNNNMPLVTEKELDAKIGRVYGEYGDDDGDIYILKVVKKLKSKKIEYIIEDIDC